MSRLGATIAPNSHRTSLAVRVTTSRGCGCGLAVLGLLALPLVAVGTILAAQLLGLLAEDMTSRDPRDFSDAVRALEHQDLWDTNTSSGPISGWDSVVGSKDFDRNGFQIHDLAVAARTPPPSD